MKSSDLKQIRVDPRDATPEFLAMVERFARNNGLHEFSVSWPTAIRMWIDAWVHPLGIHHDVPYHTFDPASQRMIEHPGKWACLRCPRVITR